MNEELYMLAGDTTVSSYILREDETLMKMIEKKIPYKKLLEYCNNNY